MAKPPEPAQPGGGRYDAECTELRARLGASGIILIVRDGIRGEGFEVQMHDPRDMLALPSVLRQLADQIEARGLPTPVYEPAPRCAICGRESWQEHEPGCRNQS